jgi:hypothetical protein
MRFIKWSLLIAVLASAFYVCTQLAMPHYNHYRFKSDAKYILSYDVKDVEDMRHRLLAHAEELGIRIPEGEMLVEHNKGVYNMKAEWSETVDFFGKYEKTFYFTVEIND